MLRSKQRRLKGVTKPKQNTQIANEIFNWRLYIQSGENIVPGLFISYANPTVSETGSIGHGSEDRYGEKHVYNVVHQQCRSIAFDGSRLRVTFQNGREVGGDMNYRYMNVKYPHNKNKEEIRELIKQATEMKLIS